MKRLLDNPIVIGLAVALLASAATALWGGMRSRLVAQQEHENPVTVSVEPDIVDFWSVAFPSDIPTISEIHEPWPEHTRIYELLRKNGAADLYETRLRVTIRGRSDEPVVVRNMRAIVQPFPAYAGAAVSAPSAGANDSTALFFDLGSPHPVAWEWRCDEETTVGTRPYFSTHNVTVRKGEIHDFYIVARIGKGGARWSILADLEVGDQKKSLEIADTAGRPFETTSYPPRPNASYFEWDPYAGGFRSSKAEYDEWYWGTWMAGEAQPGPEP